MTRDADLSAYEELVLDPSASHDGVRLVLGMLSTVDGAIALDGRSHGLGGPADRVALRSLRDACDVILVGAGTVRAEGYGTLGDSEERRQRRRRRGLRPTPRLAVVTATGDLPPGHPLFVDPEEPALVVTLDHTLSEVRGRLERLGYLDHVEVVVAGDRELDATRLRTQLARRGLLRVVCEGGPRLAGVLVQQDAIDEYFVTVAPSVVGGAGGGLLHGADERLRSLRLIWCVVSGDEVLLRYEIARP